MRRPPLHRLVPILPCLLALACEPPATPADLGVACLPGAVIPCALTDDCEGRSTCIDGAFGLCEAPTEQCNRVDDDCDGAVDEDFAELGEPCGVEGGACGPGSGVWVCDDDGGLRCDGEAIEPTDEICNGADDDCDGQIDEGLDAGREVCDGLDDDCDGQIDEGFDAIPETCNGLDDDCDGAADEDFLGAAEVCNGADEDCDGQIDEGLGGAACDTAQAGVCAAGRTVCEDGVRRCEADGEPSPERCNGIDDDCDGQTDEGLGGSPCDTGADGICADGVSVCDHGGLICAPTARPQDELCNGMDDDCDGVSDEGLGERMCDTGQFGLCASGLTLCAGGVVVCTPTLEPEDESCNGLDDDCDGVPDEGLPDGAPCETGQPGICAAGTAACVAGVLDCVPDTEPGPEQCNGLDDDCDGALDEGLGGSACDTGQAGVCAAGQAVCAGGEMICEPSAAAGPERCNGADDDCDGVIDEGQDECDPCFPGADACDGIDTDCDGAVDEDCDPGCDGVDDDGDGQSDEGCAEVTCGGEAPVPPCNGCPAGVVVPAGWVCIPPGTFTMGSPEDEEAHRPDEWPQREVAITRPFLMMRTELTRAAWATVAEPAGGAVPPAEPCDADAPGACPVERVNWHETLWFAHHASRAAGLAPCHDPATFDQCGAEPGAGCPDGDPLCNAGTFDCTGAVPPLSDIELDCEGMRLPTEAEWEYATRAGSDGWCWRGDGADALEPIAWTSADARPAQPVGQLAPNPWGLYDVHGNVAEWTLDTAVPYPRDGALDVDPYVSEPFAGRAVRGGSVYTPAAACRSADRSTESSVSRVITTGFRLVRTIAAPE